jgi:hypothetical protein
MKLLDSADARAHRNHLTAHVLLAEEAVCSFSASHSLYNWRVGITNGILSGRPWRWIRDEPCNRKPEYVLVIIDAGAQAFDYDPVVGRKSCRRCFILLGYGLGSENACPDQPGFLDGLISLEDRVDEPMYSGEGLHPLKVESE